MKVQLLLLIVLFTAVYIKAEGKKDKMDRSYIGNMTVKDMDHKDVNLSKYNGKVLMIVNVASKCGNTPQYSDLEKLYESYRDKGFEILAFPCNDFGGQEPGTNDQIKEFCTVNYGVKFKLFDKIKVLGDEKSPLYDKLTNNDVTGTGDVKWNFEKFIISKDGKIVARFGNKVQPMDPAIVASIDDELKK